MNLPQKSYIVCSTGRSGSTLLCKTLSQLSGCGKPDEYFHHNLLRPLELKDHPERLIDHLKETLTQGTTENGVFGIKMHWWQLQNILRIARKLEPYREKSDIEILNDFFPNPRFIYIRRKNLARQAISTLIALQTKCWVQPVQGNSRTASSTASRKLHFDPTKIFFWERSFSHQNQAWESFFKRNNLQHCEIVYEDFVKTFESSMIEVLDHLGLDIDLTNQPLKMPTQKQSSAVNDRWYLYYRLIPKFLLRGHRYIEDTFRRQKKKETQAVVESCD